MRGTGIVRCKGGAAPSSPGPPREKEKDVAAGSASPRRAAAEVLQWNVVVENVAAQCATAVGRVRVREWVDVDTALATTRQDADERLAQTAAAAQVQRLPAGEGGLMFGRWRD